MKNRGCNNKTDLSCSLPGNLHVFVEPSGVFVSIFFGRGESLKDANAQSNLSTSQNKHINFYVQKGGGGSWFSPYFCLIWLKKLLLPQLATCLRLQPRQTCPGCTFVPLGGNACAARKMSWKNGVLLGGVTFWTTKVGDKHTQNLALEDLGLCIYIYMYII